MSTWLRTSPGTTGSSRAACCRAAGLIRESSAGRCSMKRLIVSHNQVRTAPQTPPPFSPQTPGWKVQHDAADSVAQSGEDPSPAKLENPFRQCFEFCVSFPRLVHRVAHWMGRTGSYLLHKKLNSVSPTIFFQYEWHVLCNLLHWIMVCAKWVAHFLAEINCVISW